MTRHLPVSTREYRCLQKGPDSFDGCGKNHYSFSLLLNEQVGRSTDIQRYYHECVSPVSGIKCFGNVRAGEKEEYSFLSVNEENIIGTAVYREKGKIVARFFECNGEAVEAHITVPERITKARTVDLEGKVLEFGASFDARSHVLTVPFGKYQIVTIKLEGEALC